MKHYIFIGLLMLIQISAYSKENDKFTIVHSKQKVTFFMEKSDLMAMVETEETVRSNVSTSEFFKKIMFYDENTVLDKISINGKSVPYIESDDLPTSEIFHSDSKLVYVDFYFNKKSEEIVIKTRKTFTDFKFIDLLRFQQYPFEVLKSEIRIEMPLWLDCKLAKFNLETSGIVESNFSTKNMKILNFTAINLPAREEFKLMPDSRHFIPHILLMPASLIDDGEVRPLIADVKDLYRWYSTIASRIGNEDEILKPIIAQIINPDMNDIDKIKSIFYYVQDNIKYIAFEHGIMGLRPASCQKLIADKFGDCKGMANLTVQLLKMAGFDARLTWIGTNGQPYNYDTPSFYVDNHMICTVVKDEKFLFLDATEKDSDFGTYADRIQGREVLIEDGDNFIRTRVPVSNPLENISSHIVELELASDNTLTGKATVKYRGNSKSSMKSMLSSSAKKDFQDALKYILDHQPNNKISNAMVKGLGRDSLVDVLYNCTLKNRITNAGGELYLNLDSEKYFEDLEAEANRIIPFFFSSKICVKKQTTIKLLPNQKVTYVPESVSYNSKFGKFDFKVVAKDNSIEYSKELIMNETMMQPEEFEEWNKFIKKLKNFYSDNAIIENN